MLLPMPEEEEEDPRMETLIRFATIGEARVAAGLLEAAGIESFVPDETTAGVAPHLSDALGGYRLQVPRAEVARAREVLASDTIEDEERESHPEIRHPDDPQPSRRERAAIRAWRAAVIGIVLCPGILHVLSVWQLVDVVYGSGPLSRGAKARAIGAAALDVAGIVFAGLVARAFFR